MKLVWDRVWVYKAPQGALKHTKFKNSSLRLSWLCPVRKHKLRVSGRHVSQMISLHGNCKDVAWLGFALSHSVSFLYLLIQVFLEVTQAPG